MSEQSTHSTHSKSGGSDSRRALRAFVLLLVLSIAFFSRPLSRLGSSYYSSADLGQESPLTRSPDAGRARNPLLSDPAVQMQPWLMFNRETLASGHLPLWNDANGAGAPHLANYQSAVFSPFSLPYYVLSFRAALLVSAFAKLVLLGLFTYLFLREIGLAELAALLGAVAFAFSGLNVLLLAYPHSAVAITLPAGLFFFEKLVHARERALRERATSPRAGAGGIGWLVAFTLCLTAGVFAGHPEPFCLAVLVIGAYATARLRHLGWTRRANPGIRLAVSRLALEIAAASVIALGLAAIELIPFFEYLAHSTTLAVRSQGQAALEIANWPLWFFPDLLGNPSTSHLLAYDLPHPNYEDVNTVYVGALVLWLALLGAFVARTRRFVFFAACTAIGLLYGYHGLPLERLFGWNLALSAVPMNRIQLVIVFGACVCAATCIDHLERHAFRSEKRAIVAAASLAIAVACIAWFGADRLLALHASHPRAAGHVAFAAQHRLWLGIAFGAGASIVLALCVLRHTIARRALGAALVVAVFLASGFLLKDYNPTIEDAAFFPRTPAIQELARAVGDHRLMILGDRSLPPETNLAQGLRVASSYDALWVHEFDELYRALFGAKDNWRIAEHASESGLVLCGVEYVLTRGSWPAVDAAVDAEASPSGRSELVELSADHVLHQAFTASSDRLQAIELRVSHATGAVPRRLRAALADLATGEEIASSELDLDAAETIPVAAQASAMVSRSVAFQFAPIAGSRGKHYRLTLRAVGERASDALFVWVNPGQPPALSTTDVFDLDGRPSNRRAWFRCSYNLDAFEPVWRSPAYTLHRYLRSPTRYFCVDGAEIARTDEDALRRLMSRDFDPTRRVLLGSGETGTAIESRDAGPAQPAQVIEDAHSRVRLRIERAKPGYLVITRAHYPGWRARVNGIERPLLRADFGLSAVELAAGTSEIELAYEPGSFDLGLAVSAASALLGAAWVIFAARRARGAIASP